MTMLLEVCVDSMDSAVAAKAGGADRLEVCSALSAEGTTPSCGLTQHCVDSVGLPVMMMIRPHGGGFVYTEHDVQTMLTDIEMAKSLAVHGVVFGALTEGGAIHQEHCGRLLDAAEGLQTTFHRAFDVVRDPSGSLEQIIALGFDRLLTSGQQETAVQGVPLLRALNQQSQGRLVVIAASGVTAENARQIVEQTGVSEVHASASQAVPIDARHQRLRFGVQHRVTSESQVRTLKQSLRQ